MHGSTATSRSKQASTRTDTKLRGGHGKLKATTRQQIEVGEEGNRRRSSPWSSWTRLGSAGVAGYVEPDDELRRSWRRRPAMASVRRGPTQFKARRRSSGRRGSSWASSRTPRRPVGATTTATMASTVRAMTILPRASGRGENEG